MSRLRGRIRLVPPQFNHNFNCLHYGQCVDVFHEDAWWEGVVFDHDDMSDERTVFFPDIGDELRARVENIRFTHDWDAETDVWKFRGDWVFLEVLEELEVEWPIVVSVKQIWYELRMKKRFKGEIKEWTCEVKEVWKEAVKEVVLDNLKLTMVDFFARLQRDGHQILDINKKFLDSIVNIKPSFFTSIEELPFDSNHLPVEECELPFDDDDNADDGDMGPPGFSKNEVVVSKRFPEESYQWTQLHDFHIFDPHLVVEAKCCPGSVVRCNQLCNHNKKPTPQLLSELRQHLLYLGWKVEVKRDFFGGKYKESIRYRYTNPTEEDGNWRKTDVDLRELQRRAKRHLFAVGWSMYFREGTRKRPVYQSPNGKKFCSIRTACNFYILENSSHGSGNCSEVNVGTGEGGTSEGGDSQKKSKERGVGRLVIKKKDGVLSIEVVEKRKEAFVNSLYEETENSPRKPRVLRSSKRAREDISPMHQTPRTVLSWLIDNSVIVPRSKVQYRCRKDGHTMKEGRFETHAGSLNRRPSANIFLEDGRSLLDCQLQLKSKQNARLCKTESRRLKGGPGCMMTHHVGCLKLKEGVLKLASYPQVNWFCSMRCEEIYSGINKLLGEAIPVGQDDLTWTILKHKRPEGTNHDNTLLMDEEVAECYSKLNVAISVMHECFEPVMEPRTQRDIVEDVIFCRWSELNRLNFKGFYTVLLEKDDELVSAATIRIYGEKVAELPLIGTRFRYRRRGMCHALMNVLEKKLVELGVERLVLPAVPSVLQTWTSSFGFSVMTEAQKLDFLGYTFLDFQGTHMCQKLLGNAQPSADSSISRGNVCEIINGSNAIELDGVSAVSEVSQAERVEESMMVDQHPLNIDQGNQTNNDSSSSPPLEVLANQPSHVEYQSEISVECTMEASNSKEDDNNGHLKCYHRRKIVSCES
ncbi:hypothetical protein M8C21_008335 [Ambrosia artemisiifolia]|uniref:N-acetyltransferase domain-containing protein n=1 Tax=Ambrosia artemisiifolia TaxID=4212 RepID=A0AAD5C622_AMBAR|nr:hypothetical protein M8C21_008335 [Ambrosia artemisiifolia]